MEAITKAGITPEAESGVTMLPDSWVSINDVNVARSVMKIVDALEDLDDVQNVYTNMDVDEAVLAKLGEE